MTPNNHLANRFSKWKFFSVLPGLMLAHAALATDPLYQNDAVLNYIVPGNPPPNIDATNFVNNNWFTVVFSTYTFGTEFYEPWNTVNYTNNGFMSVDSGFPFVSPGFQFDTQTTNVMPHQMAGSFYNPGTIFCGTLANSPFLFTAGQLIVWATNIANPGTIVMGPNTVMRLTGGNVDLSRSTLTMQGFGIFNSPVALGADWGTGTDTNADWVPSTDLTPTNALSSVYHTFHSPLNVNYTFLNNSTPYFQIDGSGTSNVVVRAVFFSDQSSANVTHNVYFHANTIGGGFATVEWVGSYVDSASGLTLTDYLYLNDDYVLGSATNVLIFNGVPANFVFAATNAPIFIGTPTASGFPAGIFQPAGAVVTNTYSYVDAQLVSTTVATNASPSNPTGALTNLPDRIYITASRELDLTLADIRGANYLSLMATNLNQFDGSAGAVIIAPYSDINLGVTNGFLTASNVLKAALPNWSGSVQAWSARWVFVGTNGVTNDFRVLLVNSQLSPTTLSQVQHLTLHGTNSVVISDAFNILSTLFIDARNLTLTTNGYGNGATSPEGELNLGSTAILWPSSLPNLHWLTNNGAISTMNLALFGSGDTPTYTTNITPAIAATGTLSEVDTNGNVPATNTVTIGTYTYAFVNTITNTVPNQIKIAATFDGSMSNLIAAINHAAGSGTSYSTNVTANMWVMAGLLTNHSFTVTARTNGSSGNTIGTTSSTTNLTWNGSTLSGGVDAVTNVVVAGGPYGAFVNRGRVSNAGGSTIWANDFENSGPFSSGTGSFALHSLTTTLINGSITAGGDVSITTGSLVTSNLLLRAGRSLTLQVTNLLTDTGAVNGNVWSVGASSLVGLNLPIKPLVGDLLGTTISCTAPPPNKQVVNTWAGQDYGVSTAGYTNNAAIGKLILDALGPNSIFQFNGTGVSNALYVDDLDLRDYAAIFDGTHVNALAFNPNLVIYYANATIAGGVSVAEKLNHLNGNHLRWVPMYIGYFSSTYIGYTNADGTITTNGPFNAGLAQSTTIDSNGNGTPNGSDPTPFFVSSQIHLTLTVTNNPPLTARLMWDSIPSSTNTVYYRTNLVLGNWLPLTTNISPSLVPPAGGWPITNTITIAVTNNPSVPHFYRVRVDPNTTLLYGP